MALERIFRCLLEFVWVALIDVLRVKILVAESAVFVIIFRVDIEVCDREGDSNAIKILSTGR